MGECKVCVIGAGIIGLSSAVRIQERIPAVDITIIADEFSPNTCSDGSGGFWEPFALPEKSLAQSRQWYKDTWDFLLKLVHSSEADDLGAQLVSGYNFSDIHLPNDPSWKDQVLGFRRLTQSERKLHPENRDGVFYTTMMIDVKKYLPWLMAKFRMQNGKVLHRKITSIEQVLKKYDIVINCSGIGAYQLGDSLVQPVRGQVMRVNAPWVKHFYFDFDPTDKENKLYIFPGKDSVVLGGTQQKGDWSTLVSESDKDRILNGCSRLIPSLKHARVIGHWAGLRPSRPTVRLEKEIVNINGQNKAVIHNYGHAGSGITLHWGCAKDVADFVQESYTLRERNTIHSSKL